MVKCSRCPKNIEIGSMCEECKETNRLYQKKNREKMKQIKHNNNNNDDDDEQDGGKKRFIVDDSVTLSRENKRKYFNLDTCSDMNKKETIERKITSTKPTGQVDITEEKIKSEQNKNEHIIDKSVEDSVIDSIRKSHQETIEEIKKNAQASIDMLNKVMLESDNQKTIKCDLLENEAKEFLKQSPYWQDKMTLSYHEFMEFPKYGIFKKNECPINEKGYNDFDQYTYNQKIKDALASKGLNLTEDNVDEFLEERKKKCMSMKKDLLPPVIISDPTIKSSLKFSSYRLLALKLLNDHGCFRDKSINDEEQNNNIPKPPELIKVIRDFKVYDSELDDEEETETRQESLNKPIINDLYILNETNTVPVSSSTSRKALYLIECIFVFHPSEKHRLEGHKSVRVTFALPIKILFSIEDYKQKIQRFFQSKIAAAEQENLEGEHDFINEDYEDCEREGCRKTCK